MVIDEAFIEKCKEYSQLPLATFDKGQKIFIGFVCFGLFALSAVLFGYNYGSALVTYRNLQERKALGVSLSFGSKEDRHFHSRLPPSNDDDIGEDLIEGEIEEMYNQTHPLSDEFIREVNSSTTSWEAGRNFAENTPMEYIHKLMGVRRDNSMKTVEKLLNANRPIFVGWQDLPTEFDARTEWPQCKSISEIRDQGGCGSCWAFGATETMTDRQCIHKNETFYYSAEDLVSCCDACGSGCDGGYPISAFVHWKTDGIVSGGDYGSRKGCIPYEIEPCEHHVSGNRSACSANTTTPACHRECYESYNSTYDQDLRFAETVYSLSDEEEILRELVKNGPMEGVFDVYEDFLHYKSGVYHYVAGYLLGSHAVRVLGFGVEEGVPYYLCANSWNYNWGDGGFFKIRRDHMDRVMVSGIPA